MAMVTILTKSHFVNHCALWDLGVAFTTSGGSLSSDKRKAPGVVRCVRGRPSLSVMLYSDGHLTPVFLSERLGYEVSDLIRISCVSWSFTRISFVNALM